MWSQRPQSLQAIINALGSPEELDSKIQLLQISQIGVIEHGKVKPVLTLKPHLYQLVFIAVEGTQCMTPEENSDYQYYPAVTPASHNNNWPAILAIMAQMSCE